MFRDICRAQTYRELTAVATLHVPFLETAVLEVVQVPSGLPDRQPF